MKLAKAIRWRITWNAFRVIAKQAKAIAREWMKVMNATDRRYERVEIKKQMKNKKISNGICVWDLKRQKEGVLYTTFQG